MLENGYIRLYRSLLKWEWYDDINTKVVFLHLLLTVNHYDEKWHGIDVLRGQRICSYAKLARETMLSVKNVRTAINHLKSTGEVAHYPTAEHGLFVVVNYDKYQDVAYETADGRQSSGSQAAVKRQQSNKANKAIKQESNKDIYGECANVKLSDAELLKLKEKFTDWQERINKLSLYIASKGDKYKSHYATILQWASNERGEQTGRNKNPSSIPSTFKCTDL